MHMWNDMRTSNTESGSISFFGKLFLHWAETKGQAESRCATRIDISLSWNCCLSWEQNEMWHILNSSYRCTKISTSREQNTSTQDRSAGVRLSWFKLTAVTLCERTVNMHYQTAQVNNDEYNWIANTFHTHVRHLRPASQLWYSHILDVFWGLMLHFVNIMHFFYSLFIVQQSQ